MKYRYLAAAVSAIFMGSLMAQPAPREEKPGDDPIVAMLDSLVSLNLMNRCNFPDAKQAAEGFMPYAPVNITEETYRTRLSGLKSPIPLDYNPYVRSYIDLYASKKSYVTSKVLGLSQFYFPLFEQVLDQQGLPLELKYLSVVESALNPLAVSRAGATGIWQFMYNTAKLYGLSISSYVDERRDPYKATKAACQYFKNMYDIYHDWLLVIAAYNCGERNVNKAIARSGGKTNFWEIRRFLPLETRGYVPAFIAVNYIMNYAPQHNIPATTPDISYFETDTVTVTRYVTFEQISGLLEIPPDLVAYLNPSFRRKVIPATADAPYKIVLPANKVSAFVANVDKLYQLTPGGSESGQYEYVTKEVKKYYTVRRGETLSAIARKFDCMTSEIRQWNRMRNNYIAPGQKLLICETVVEKVDKNMRDSIRTAAKTDSLPADSMVKNNPPPSPAPANTKYIYHTVQPGDTLTSIAQKYQGSTVEQLKEINKITDVRSLIPGTRLKVPVTG